VQSRFWHERWRLGQIGFHQSVVDRQLAKYWAALGVSLGGVLVPLCGKSLDLLWLRDQGFDVTGVELSPIALESLCLQQGILARRGPNGAFEQFESRGLRLLRGDVFDLCTQALGEIHAIYDRASLIAFPPEMRARYVDHLTALTKPGTKTLLITVEYPPHQISGPPFSVSRDDVERHYGGSYAIQLLERRDILAYEARLRSRGVTQLDESSFLLTRL
jgi:thiopurine S-methyltransferase